MSPVELAAFVFLSVLGLANLTLTLAVARWVRAQARTGGAFDGAHTGSRLNVLGAGATVGEFATSTVDGAAIARTDLIGRTLVGFLSPGCPACLESLPWFAARAESTAGGPDRVLAVVAGVGAEFTEMCDRLRPLARVVVEEELGPVARAFGVESYPAFALLSGDTVVASHFVLDEIPQTAPDLLDPVPALPGSRPA